MTHDDLHQSYFGDGLLIDANLLILLVVGTCDRLLISKVRRVAGYRIEDYDYLIQFVRPFSRIVVTPNILTEVSNLLGQESGPRRSALFDEFRRLLGIVEEFFVPSKTAADLPLFHVFGLTDLGMSELARQHFLILTDDSKFASHARSLELDAVFFRSLVS